MFCYPHHHHHHGCPKWVTSSDGQVPPNAVEVSKAANSYETVYVCRAHHMGDVIPGKVIPHHRVAYIGYKNAVKKEYNYEVLVNCNDCNYYWQEAKKGEIPPDAVQAGRIGITGEILYVARGQPSNDPSTYYGGKLHPSHKVAYITYNDVEIAISRYEVLCRKPIN